MNIKQYENVIACADLIYDHQQIDAAFGVMTQEITTKLKHANPIFLCVMRGALMMMSQLMLRLHFPLHIDYLHVSRYGGGIKAKKNVNWIVQPQIQLKDRHVVIVEDILDTGLTLAFIKDYCLKEGALQVDSLALMHKENTQLSVGVQQLDFYALPVPNRFLLGYGLDYFEFYRNLNGIYAISFEKMNALLS